MKSFLAVKKYFRERKMRKVMEELQLPKFFPPERMIKEFEEVNGIPFDPYDYNHVTTARRVVHLVKGLYIDHIFGKDKEQTNDGNSKN